MNHPRNRQPYQGSQPDQRRGGSSFPRGTSRGRTNYRSSPATHRPYPTSVPSISQVIPGASVSIVLKKDQPTGHETQGIVQDVLTKGDHPRGIKVRLVGGLVGRVQRLGGPPSTQGADTTAGKSTSSSRTAASGEAAPVNRGSHFSSKYSDVRLEPEYPSEPPPRSLADYIVFPPDDADDARLEESRDDGDEVVPEFASANAQCPMCEEFEGDEVAVTHHIEQVHLT